MIAPACKAAPAALSSPPVSASAPRWPVLDLARWPAIYAIVWLHTIRSETLVRSTTLTRFAVPFFVAACVFLVFQGVWARPQRTFLQYARSRFLRIYVPFLVWSAVYLAFKVVKDAALPEQRNDFPALLDILWKGSFGHLWFMPFILAVSLVAFIVAKAVHRQQSLRWPVALVSLVAGAALCLPAVDAITSRASPCDYMAFALPAMFWGMTIGLVHGCRSAVVSTCYSRIGKPLEVLYVLIFAGSMIWLAALGPRLRSIARENLAGVSLLLVALYPAASPTLNRAARFPSLAYGIYFSHMLPIKVCEAFGKKLGVSENWEVDCTIFLVSAVAATLIAWILYQSRWTRWLVA
jgi:surface polysaccharide O-acyltransferase-like enzyme